MNDAIYLRSESIGDEPGGWQGWVSKGRTAKQEVPRKKISDVTDSSRFLWKRGRLRDAFLC